MSRLHAAMLALPLAAGKHSPQVSCQVCQTQAVNKLRSTCPETWKGQVRSPTRPSLGGKL
eukprot:4027648-Amphidinium_carterae.1